MSRFNPHHSNAPAVFEAAARWRERCLLGDGSVFTGASLWTAANVQELVSHFVENLLEGEGEFLQKLEGQMRAASPEAKQLMSEVLWLLNLFPSSVGPTAKRRQILTAWAWSGADLDGAIGVLSDEVLLGLGSAGTAFNTQRWRELRFLVNLLVAAKKLPPEERARIFTDPWACDQWIDDIQDDGSRQLKLILPHLLFPDTFERIASSAAVQQILSAFDGISRRGFLTMSKVDRDRALLKLRERLEQENEGPVDFYLEPWKSQWTAEADDEAPSPLQQTPDGIGTEGPPLNQILFGPPGTGKTFHTVDRALQILEPAFYRANATERSVLKARFDELAQEGRIGFVTFHQSLSYEDFVEGLRAEVDDQGQLRYVVADGIFKSFCRPATRAPGFSPGTVFSGGYRVLKSTDEVLWLQKPNGSQLPFAWAMLSELAEMVRGGAISIGDIRAGGVFDRVPGSRLEKYLVNGYKNILPQIVDEIVGPGGRGSRSSLPQDAPRILIIDEINRGNISRIFGELITLLEPNKRDGAAEQLTVTLPYSKQPFRVPSWLYIIGTMNTADRSLAAMDIALRRRFEFIEIEPNLAVLDGFEVAGVDLVQLLGAINSRIELLLDREHRIGHAYFIELMGAASIEPLARVFRTRILPLLQEYFFDDWQRIALVLNDHRKPDPADRFVVERERNREDLFGEAAVGAPGNTSWTVNWRALDRPSAYLGTIGT